MADEIVTSFVWTIKNFDMCPHLQNQPLCSSKLSVGSYEFQIHLYPRGSKDPSYIAAYLKRLDDWEAAEISVKVRVSLVDDKMCLQNNFVFEKLYGNDCIWGLSRFTEREKILTTERKKLLPNNNLTIRCDLLSLSVSKEKSDDEESEWNDNLDTEILSHDFAEILNSGNHSDIVLVVDGKKFNVHKAIIECRCPKLISELKETKAVNEYSLDIIKAPVLRALLQYLYTGILTIANMHEEILVACNAFNIPDLGHLMRITRSRTVRATTEIAVFQLSFTLSIADFSHLQLNQELVYPAFCVTEDEWCKMKVIITLIESGIQIKFRKLNSNTVKFIRCKISFNHLDTAVKDYEHLFQGQDWIIPSVSRIKRGQLLLDDALDICFDVSMSNEKTNSKIEKVSVKSKVKKRTSEVIKNVKLLQKDLSRLVNDNNLTDIIIRAGNSKFQAHKVILCARSRVFSKMFENDTLEKQAGIVSIQDIDSETISSMLRYIYCGCIDGMDVSEAVRLYAAADKYELSILRDKCSAFLKISVDPDNVGEILLLADAHCDESLKKCAYDYITRNPQKVLKSKTGLSVLKNNSSVYSDLTKAFLEYILSRDINDESTDYVSVLKTLSNP